MEVEPHDQTPVVEEALSICLATLCSHGERDIRWLLLARAVSQIWREAVDTSFGFLPWIAFPIHVTGADVLALLIRVAGTNLKTVSLEGCRQLSAVDIGRILVDLAARCPAVIEVNLTGCREEAILRALAVCAQGTFGAVSPADFRALLLAQAEEGASGKEGGGVSGGEGGAHKRSCSLGHILPRLHYPRLLFDADFAPGPDAFRKAVKCAVGHQVTAEAEAEAEAEEARAEADEAVYDVAVLLACAWGASDGDDDDEAITFDCNERMFGDGNERMFDEDADRPGQRALHLVAERGGPVPLLSLLTSAGADVNATDQNRQTPLHLSAAKGSEAACRVLIEHRANVNARDKDGNTALELTKDTATFECLWASGADITDEGKNSLLRRYAQKGNARVLRALLQAGANAAHTIDTNAIKIDDTVKAAVTFTSNSIRAEEVPKDTLGTVTRIRCNSDKRQWYDDNDNYNSDSIDYGSESSSSDEDGDGDQPGQAASLGTGAGRHVLIRFHGLGAPIRAQWVRMERFNEVLVVQGCTALMLACKHGHEAAAAELMEATKRAGALDLQDDGRAGKRSALHWASDNGLADTVATLLSLGADAMLTDEDGKTPFDLAFKECPQDLVMDFGNGFGKDLRVTAGMHVQTRVRKGVVISDDGDAACNTYEVRWSDGEPPSWLDTEDIVLDDHRFVDVDVRITEGMHVLERAKKGVVITDDGPEDCPYEVRWSDGELETCLCSEDIVMDELFHCGLVAAEKVKAAFVEHTVITDDNKNALLLACARGGFAPLLRAVLQAGANAAHADREGRTALMLACENKHEAATELLLAPTVSAGALDAQNSCKLSALMYASSSGLAGMVAKLLALGADTALTDREGRTALLLACYNGHEAAAAELMEATKLAGAMDLQHVYAKRSALHVASEKGLADTVAQLLALGADAALTDAVRAFPCVKT